MTHENENSDEYIILQPTDLEEIVEPAGVSLPNSGLLALPDLTDFNADAGGLPSLLVMPPPRVPASAPPRSLVAAALLAAVAMMGAVAFAAVSARMDTTPTIAQPEELPLTTIAPLDEPARLTVVPTAPIEPVTERIEITAPVEPEPTPVARVTRPVRRPPAAPAAVIPPSCGDEIECLLADGSDTPFEPTTEPEPDPRRPESLDSFAISSVMKRVAQAASRCDDTYGSGVVTVRVTVDDNGKVTKVAIKSTPSEPLAACVADAIRATDFPESRTGATFNYVFPFR